MLFLLHVGLEQCEVWGVKSAVWRVKCEGISGKWEVWSVECEVWSVKFQFGVWRAQCEVWSVRFGVWRKQCEVWSVKCGVWSLKFGVRRVQCEVRSVECEDFASSLAEKIKRLSREGHGRDRVSLNYRSFMFGKLPPPACPGLCYMWWYDMKWYVMVCGDLMGFDGFLHRASTCFKKNQKKLQKHVRFWVDLEGCNFIVPKNCLRSGAPIL